MANIRLRHSVLCEGVFPSPQICTTSIPRSQGHKGADYWRMVTICPNCVRACVIKATNGYQELICGTLGDCGGFLRETIGTLGDCGGFLRETIWG